MKDRRIQSSKKNRSSSRISVKMLAKAGKINLSILFQLEFQQEKAATKTKIMPKAGKINFSIL